MLPPASYWLNICSDIRKREHECWKSCSLEVVYETSTKPNGAKAEFNNCLIYIPHTRKNTVIGLDYVEHEELNN